VVDRRGRLRRAGTEAHGQRLCTDRATITRLRPGSASRPAPRALGPRMAQHALRGARRAAMTPMMTSARSRGGDMSTPQKHAPTRHYLKMT
jgi:hypothetical protein